MSIIKNPAAVIGGLALAVFAAYNIGASSVDTAPAPAPIPIEESSPPDCGPEANGSCWGNPPSWTQGDLDCADVTGTVWVGGSDPHGLDGDGDGWGCE